MKTISPRIMISIRAHWKLTPSSTLLSDVSSRPSFPVSANGRRRAVHKVSKLLPENRWFRLRPHAATENCPVYHRQRYLLVSITRIYAESHTAPMIYVMMQYFRRLNDGTLIHVNLKASVFSSIVPLVNAMGKFHLNSTWDSQTEKGHFEVRQRIPEKQHAFLHTGMQRRFVFCSQFLPQHSHMKHAVQLKLLCNSRIAW